MLPGFGFGSIGNSLMKGVSKMGNLLAGDAAAPAEASSAAAAAAAAAAATAAVASGSNLPAGWESMLDERGMVCYSHPETRVTQCASSP
jgi:hypothetical protein